MICTALVAYSQLQYGDKKGHQGEHFLALVHLVDQRQWERAILFVKGSYKWVGGTAVGRKFGRRFGMVSYVYFQVYFGLYIHHKPYCPSHVTIHDCVPSTLKEWMYLLRAMPAISSPARSKVCTQVSLSWKRMFELTTKGYERYNNNKGCSWFPQIVIASPGFEGPNESEEIDLWISLTINSFLCGQGSLDPDPGSWSNVNFKSSQGRSQNTSYLSRKVLTRV